jgi:hypothetical protein
MDLASTLKHPAKNIIYNNRQHTFSNINDILAEARSFFDEIIVKYSSLGKAVAQNVTLYWRESKDKDYISKSEITKDIRIRNKKKRRRLSILL